MSLKDWEKLNITRDEVNRIGEALKNKEFRKLFADYCEEISDPENKKKYEEEITQMEKERGIDITFIHPTPGYVIKTSADGKTKTFINVASNENVEKPSSQAETNKNGCRGLSWSIPYSLAPPRPDQDNKGAICHVYDVVFNPQTLYLASKNNAFKDLVNQTAIDAVQKSFNVELDKSNLKFPKLSYKGTPKAAVIRKKSNNPPEIIEPSPIDSIYPPLSTESNDKKTDENILELKDTPVSKYATPKYQIKERHSIELANELELKNNMRLPKELVVTIDLPLLHSAQDLNLDVTNNMIYLVSEKPAKYKVEIKLPFNVDEKNGNAKFEKAKRQLLITLPIVIETKIVNRYNNNNVEIKFANNNDNNNNEHTNECEKEVELENGVRNENANDEADKNNDVDLICDFLDENVEYIMPAFSFNQVDEILAFTLHVKSCSNDSVKIKRYDDKNMALVKFCTIGAGYFPIHYSFCVQFPNGTKSIMKDVFAEAWDNNVIFQIELDDPNFTHYYVGMMPNVLEKYEILENYGKSKNPLGVTQNDNEHLEIEVKSDLGSEVTIEIKSTETVPEKRDMNTSNDEMTEDVFDDGEDGKVKKLKKSARRRMNKKMRSLSESCCEDLKDLKSSENRDVVKILKELPKKARSLSESSSDEHISSLLSTNIEKQCTKGILKHRAYDRFISECNESEYFSRNNDDSNSLRYSESIDLGICQSHDSLSESCKAQRHVRFSDNIKRQLYRSNTSILKQKKINQKKKESRRRNRRHSEGSVDLEATASSLENINEGKIDSGVDFDEKTDDGMMAKPLNEKKSQKNSAHIEFKSGFIFDLEI